MAEDITVRLEVAEGRGGNIVLKANDTIDNVKTKIINGFIEAGAPIDAGASIQLFHNKLELKSGAGKTLGDYHIGNGSTILLWRPTTFVQRPTVPRDRFGKYQH